MVRLWVANTDQDWFDFLASQPEIDEVNFCSQAVEAGFPQFKLANSFFSDLRFGAMRSAGMSLSSFIEPTNLAGVGGVRIKNGARSLQEMRTRVEKYRDLSSSIGDYTIGCRIVVQPVFLPEDRWISQPESWARSIVVGKTYSTNDHEGLSLWEKLIDAGVPSQTGKQLRLPGLAEEQYRYGEPTLIVPRLGQGAFRIVVTDAYRRCCAVSGGKVLPALDAAHIKPYVLGGTHEVSKGLLLRRDIHSLFDIGYVTVDDKYQFVSSAKESKRSTTMAKNIGDFTEHGLPCPI